MVRLTLTPAVAVLLSLVTAENLGRQATCNRDNCFRAVAASSAAPGSASASKDCASFLSATLTPDPTKVTVTKTSTPIVSSTATTTTTSVSSTVSTVTFTTSTTTTTTVTSTAPTSTVTMTASPNAKRDLEKRATVNSPSNVPTYASACSGTARYSSACLCNGAVPKTTTLKAGTTTTTVTSTAAPSTTVVATSTVTVTRTDVSTLSTTMTNTITETSTTTVTPTTTTSVAPSCTPVPTNDPRCQQPSGQCCNDSFDCSRQCTNGGAICIKACDVDNDCIYGGLSANYNPVVGYYNDKLCVGYSGCEGCSSPNRLLRRVEDMFAMKRGHFEVLKEGDRVVKRFVNE